MCSRNNEVWIAGKQERWGGGRFREEIETAEKLYGGGRKEAKK